MIDAPIQFDIPLLIIYLNEIETFICHREFKFKKVYVLGFRIIYEKLFSEYSIELVEALPSPNVTKTSHQSQPTILSDI